MPAAIKKLVSNEILECLSSLPLSDVGGLRSCLFRLGKVSRDRQDYAIALITRAELNARLGQRDAAIADLMAAYDLRFIGPATLARRINLLKSCTSVGMNDMATELARELVGSLEDSRFEGEEFNFMLSSVFFAGILSGDLSLLRKLADGYGDDVSAIVLRAIDGCAAQEIFLAHQNAVSALVENCICDVEIDLISDEFDNSIVIHTHYWLGGGLPVAVRVMKEYAKVLERVLRDSGMDWNPLASFLATSFAPLPADDPEISDDAVMNND